MSSSESATRPLPVLTLRAAEIVSAASQKKAQEIGIDVNIAIVDTTLNLLHFVRQPNAKLTSIKTAIDKAFTACGHRQPTSAYKTDVFTPGGYGYGIHMSNGGRFVIIGGGVPISFDGVVVGAVGVSSGSPTQDVEICMAGVNALEAWVGKRQGPKL